MSVLSPKEAEKRRRKSLKERMFGVIYSNGSCEEFKNILYQGANPEWRLDKRTTLAAAVSAGRDDIVDVLLSRNVRVCYFNDEPQNAPIEAAIINSRPEILRKLLGHDSRFITWKSGFYLSPVQRAADLGQLECLKVLVESGMSYQDKTEFGETPLHLAAAGGRLSCVEFLLDLGAHVEIRDNKGLTPLAHAIGGPWLFGKVPVIELLLRRGADPFVQDNSGAGLLSKAKTEEVRSLIEAARLHWKLDRRIGLDSSEHDVPGMGL